jgi:hypothetical protein
MGKLKLYQILNISIKIRFMKLWANKFLKTLGRAIIAVYSPMDKLAQEKATQWLEQKKTEELFQ